MSESSYTRVPVLGRQLRDFLVAGVLALVIASAAFVGVRNRELAARQIDLASRSADAVADGRDALPTVHAALVGEPRVSTKHPYLRRRLIHEGGKARVLGADPRGPDDKLFYDAANRAPVSEVLPDGTGRALVAKKAPGGVAIAVTAPAAPAPYPFLVFVGVLGLGASLAAAGALVGRNAARLGTLAGIATLAVPTLLWQSWVAASLILVLAIAVAAMQHAGATDRFSRGLVMHRVALSFLSPAAVAMSVLVAAPFVIGLLLGFYDHHQGTWTFVGLDNFTRILSGNGHSLDDPLNFWFILGVTVLWTVANIALHVTVGVSLALVLSRKWLRGKGIFRMLLILPWAIPNYITALMWKGMFQGQYG
ncbi:MAG TPA: sugar ABC transporter permease, partial [Kofleriaceae bacterium]|nr:sugar ABC transporter permease [Kofleriaceae bacterium]